eukprot:sb/3474237/
MSLLEPVRTGSSKHQTVNDKEKWQVSGYTQIQPHGATPRDPSCAGGNLSSCSRSTPFQDCFKQNSRAVIKDVQGVGQTCIDFQICSEKGQFCVGNFETDAYKVLFGYHTCGQICKDAMLDNKVFKESPKPQRSSEVPFDL